MAANAVLLRSVGIVDLLLVASLGEISVAAFGIAGAIMAFIIGIQGAIANGTQLVVSRAVGAGDKLNVGAETTSGWVANLGFSLLAIVALYFGIEPLIHLISHNDHVAVEAVSYVKISLILLAFSSASHVFVSYFNACKKTKIPFYGFILEIPVNVICSVVLIYGLWGMPKLGLAGAAWGSVIAIVIRFTYLAYRMKQEQRIGRVAGLGKFSRRSLKIHLDEVIPIVANFVVLLTGQLVLQALFAQLSVSSYAAITLILPWIQIGSLFVNSWAQSSTIIVSQSLGQKNYAVIPDFVLESKLVATAMSLLMVLGFYLFSLSLPYLYGNLSAETIAALAMIAPCYIFIPIFRTNNMFCGNMIRAMGESYLIVRINIITLLCISIPLCALLIYLGAPLFMVFGIIIFDEMLKFYFFQRTLTNKLNKYRAMNANSDPVSLGCGQPGS
ncbi:putative MATE family efflux protein [Reinekea marinisedimentorum]|uniref:Putative MATE family efflux protein n=2 Tax=Reinekea marinisedimentorum TaxID=230495 RepID=A0A4R3IAU6_9GAMM|nr:putative MATE family efflux protein [Reinekea marinisedimentorum]